MKRGVVQSSSISLEQIMRGVLRRSSISFTVLIQMRIKMRTTTQIMSMIAQMNLQEEIKADAWGATRLPKATFLLWSGA